ncbi:MAG: hypothetical protein M1840_002171 [Geoglossum simile]|nr:MAG: hypothetical protein M1840_002171 [Geoglossum simile]
MASAVLARDPSCRLSSYRDCGSCAHICPSAQTSWFTTNGMQRYNLQQQSSFIYLVDDVRNRLVLRLDLHSDFDKKKFVFVPKMGMLVTHMLQPTYELGRLYHNIPLLETPDVSIEFLLARFAWSIFPSINGFLAAGVPRLLQRASLQQDACPKSMLVKASAQICRELGGAKAPSPTKRKAPTGGREDDAGSDNEGHSRKRVRASPFSGDAGPSRSPSDDGDEEAGDCSVTLPQYSYGCTATAKGIYRRGLTDDTPDCDTLRLSIEEGF